jgi:hypothetical protein
VRTTAQLLSANNARLMEEKKVYNSRFRGSTRPSKRTRPQLRSLKQKHADWALTQKPHLMGLKPCSETSTNSWERKGNYTNLWKKPLWTKRRNKNSAIASDSIWVAFGQRELTLMKFGKLCEE